MEIMTRVHFIKIAYQYHSLLFCKSMKIIYTRKHFWKSVLEFVLKQILYTRSEYLSLCHFPMRKIVQSFLFFSNEFFLVEYWISGTEKKPEGARRGQMILKTFQNMAIIFPGNISATRRHPRLWYQGISSGNIIWVFWNIFRSEFYHTAEVSKTNKL